MTHEDGAKNEKLPPGVISIKPPPRFGMFGSMLIRLTLGILLLGAGVAALYYSIEVHGTDDKADDSTPIEKTYFSLNRTQFSLTGIYTREDHLGIDTSGNPIRKTTKISAQWAQLVDDKRLFFSHGTPFEKDWEQSWYFYANFSIEVFPNKTCHRINGMGYDEFLLATGLHNLLYIRSEEIITSPNKGNIDMAAETSGEDDGGDEGYTSVNFFQGDPSNNNWYQGAFLGIGYMDTSNSKSMAWQVYFEENDDMKGKYFVEYWFPEMQTNNVNVDLLSPPVFCFPE